MALVSFREKYGPWGTVNDRPAGKNLWITSQNQRFATATMADIRVSVRWDQFSMDFSVILSVLLALCATCYVLLAIRLAAGPREIGSIPLAVIFALIGLWVSGGSVELAASSYAVFSIGRMGHFVGSALVPVALLVCFREYTGSKTSLTAIVTLLIAPVFSIVVAATNYWHEFMWLLPAANASGEFLTRPVAWGPWFLFVHAPFSYGIVTAALLTLAMRSSAVARTQRRALFICGGTAIAPIAAAVIYDFGYGPNTVSTLSCVFAALLPIYAWLAIGKNVIEFTPFAYETVFQNMPDPVIVVDHEERVIGLNHGAEALLELAEKDAMLAPITRFFDAGAPEIRIAIDTGQPQKIVTRSGRFLHLQVTPIATNNAIARKGQVLMFRDVSDVEKAQKEVKSSERLLRTLIDHSVNGIIRFRWVSEGEPDAQGELQCIFANGAAGRFLNADSDAMIDQSADEIIRLASSGLNSGEAELLLTQFRNAANNREMLDTETRVEFDGSAKWLRVIGEPVSDDMAITFVDITDRKAKEIQMESIALSDPLTGIPNRRGFERDAARRLAASNDDATGALLFIDLNGFKQINDEYGHEVGDELLIIAADRLKSSMRSCDIVGRPGGDEFVALVPDVSGDIAEKLAGRLTSCLEQDYLIDDKSLHCTASIGLALYPEHANTLTGLLRAADAAMYRAKARSRGGSDVQHLDLLEKAV